MPLWFDMLALVGWAACKYSFITHQKISEHKRGFSPRNRVLAVGDLPASGMLVCPVCSCLPIASARYMPVGDVVGGEE